MLHRVALGDAAVARVASLLAASGGGCAAARHTFRPYSTDIALCRFLVTRDTRTCVVWKRILSCRQARSGCKGTTSVIRLTRETTARFRCRSSLVGFSTRYSDNLCCATCHAPSYVYEQGCVARGKIAAREYHLVPYACVQVWPPSEAGLIEQQFPPPMMR